MKSIKELIAENKAAHIAWAESGGMERDEFGMRLTEEQQRAADAMEKSDGELLMAYQFARDFKTDAEGLAQAEAYLKIQKQMRRKPGTK